jgi:transcriptional regulator GlxA family with amidase domain
MLVAILIPPSGHSLEICGPGDVFAEANRQQGRRIYDLQVVSEQVGPLTCFSGLRVLPDRTIHDADEAIDTLIVTGPRDPPGAVIPPVTEWLRRRCPATRRFGSVCTGTFLLGAAGLLDGKHVTTHWEFAPALAAAYPTAIVEPDRIFVRDGPLFTSAGVTAGMDLALALVEEDLGRSAALSVARWLVMFLKRPGGQSQFSVQLATQTAVRSPIERVLQWVRDNPQAELSVVALAQRAGMSARNFARTFRQDTGLTPAEFVEATRVDIARRLLEETDLPLQRVASASGFGRSEALRRAFIRRLGVRPIEYRSRFR